MKIVKYISSVILLTSFLNFGCGSAISDSDLISKAQAAIDQQQFGQALNYLSSVRTKTDESISLQTSAYAGLAGFRAFRIYDIVSIHKDVSPTFLFLFFISNQYDSSSLEYSRLAISTIEDYNKSILSRSNQLNLPFSLVEFYKTSQILLKDSDLDHTGYFSNKWNPCLAEDFPLSDVRETIVSINKGIIAINKIKNVINDPDTLLFFTLITNLQREIGIDTTVTDPEAVQNSDVGTFRNFLNHSILKNNNTCT